MRIDCNRIVGFLLYFIVFTGAVAYTPAHAAGPFQRRVTDPELARAILRFNSAQHLESEVLFDAVIERIAARDSALSPQDIETLVEALSYRSQVRLNADLEALAVRDLTWILQIQPQFEFDTSIVSPRVVQLLRATQQRLSAPVRIPSAEGAKVLFDGRRVDSASVVGSEPGTHTINVERGGRQTSCLVTSKAGTEVQLPEVCDKTPISFKRRLLLRADTQLVSYSQIFVGRTTFPLYNQTATLTSTYTYPKPSRTYGTSFSVAVRGAKRFAFGLTATQARRSVNASVDGQIPSPTVTGAFRRVFFPANGLQRTENGYHLELGATGGRRSWELAAFAGPSLFRVKQEAIGSITVQETAGLPVTSMRRVQLTGKSAIGFHMGSDFSWMFFQFVGVGVGARYARATMEMSQGDAVVVGSLATTFGIRIRY